jgi:hypothetical protein
MPATMVPLALWYVIKGYSILGEVYEGGYYSNFA